MSKKIVIDTSVIIKWLNKNKETELDKADKILDDARDRKISIIAPDICLYEIGKILLLNKKLSQTESKIVFDALFDLPIKFYSLSSDLSKEAYAISSAFGLSFEEGCFLALAEREKADYITTNVNKDVKLLGAQIIDLVNYPPVNPQTS